MTTREVAQRLDCTRQNVQYHYDKKNLKGPARKAGDPIRIWTSSVDDFARTGPRRSSRRRQTADGLSNAANVQLQELVLAAERMEARLAAVEDHLNRLDLDAEQRSTAVAALLSVDAEMVIALEESNRAVNLLSQANQASSSSTEALMRAHTLRTEVIRQFDLPASPP